MSSSRIKWVNDLITWIESKLGLELWMKTYLSDLLVVMKGLIQKAGQDWLEKTQAIVIVAASMQLSGTEKAKWVTDQLIATGVLSVSELSTSEVNVLVEYILNKCKQAGVIK